MASTIDLLQSQAQKIAWTPSKESNGPSTIDIKQKALQDNSWADGLRGIAAVYVVFSHMTLTFALFIIPPLRAPGEASYMMQRPIFRLVAQGPAWVACFLILSGFVNCLKPLKLAQAGQIDTALANLSVSAFRRAFRLVLPALAATVISWFICQLGAYETARNSDAYWIAVTSPRRSISWCNAIDDLAHAILDTWLFNPNNIYDQPQWALLYLLLGSMITFVALLITINLVPRWRVAVCALGFIWAWNWDTLIRSPLVAVATFGGILLAELNLSSYPQRFASWFTIFTPPGLILSLFLMSFPSEFQQNAGWSNFLLKLHRILFKEDVLLERAWPTMGALLLIFTIIMSPHLRRLLSHRYLLFLGKISFPLYLLHGMLMRSLLAWLLFFRSHLVEMQERSGDRTYVVMKYPLPGPATFIVVLPIFFAILFMAAYYWTIHVEPHFAAMTKTAEETMFGKGDASVKTTPLPIRAD